MSVMLKGPSNVVAEVEAEKAIRTVLVGRGDPYTVAATTGVVAAGAVANALFFAMRFNPGATGRVAFIERVRLQWTTLTAFSVPLTAARRIELVRGSVAAPSGQTAITAAVQKDTTSGASHFNASNGGDMRISGTGALTLGSAVIESSPIRQMSLAHVGAAGAFFEEIFEFAASESHPLAIQPGQLLAVRTPVAMDAAGTFQLAIAVDWHEAAAL